MTPRHVANQGSIHAGVWLVIIAALCAWVAARAGLATGVRPPPREPTVCRAELRSWVVLGRGRHLYLEIACPGSERELNGRIEFTTVMMRTDYRYTRDATGRPRVGRMRGGRIGPPSIAGPPDNRLEAVYQLTMDQARCLQRDRVFEAEYVLVGANSNAAMRRVMTDCGLALPERVRAGGGLMGEFPGIDFDVGAEIAPAEWAAHGVVRDDERR